MYSDAMADTPSGVAGLPANRSLAYIGAGIVALVIATSIIVVVAGGRGQEAPLPAGSPQAALQEYLAAFADGDYEAAFAYFSSDVRAGTSARDYDQMVRSYGQPYGDGSTRRVLFDGVIGEGERVTVQLTVEEFYGGGLAGGDTYRSPREIRMRREGGAWRIDEPLIWLDPSPPFLK